MAPRSAPWARRPYLASTPLVTAVRADARRRDHRPPEAAAIVALARENVRLLAAFARRFEVAGLDADPEGRVVRHPADVADHLGHEMADLAQEV